MSEEQTPEFNESDEWEEEICPQEVERVIQRLDQILETVENDTIHEYLTEAYERIEALVEWEDDDDGRAEAA